MALILFQQSLYFVEIKYVEMTTKDNICSCYGLVDTSLDCGSNGSWFESRRCRGSSLLPNNHYVQTPKITKKITKTVFIKNNHTCLTWAKDVFECVCGRGGADAYSNIIKT